MKGQSSQSKISWQTSTDLWGNSSVEDRPVIVPRVAADIMVQHRGTVGELCSLLIEALPCREKDMLGTETYLVFEATTHILKIPNHSPDKQKNER